MKTVLVTGASRGIGAATALRAARGGYRVLVHYHNYRIGAEQVLKQMQSLGTEAYLLQADLCKEEEVKAMFQTVKKWSFGLDALVNNAGMLLPQGSFIDLPAQRWRKMWENNTLSAILCCQEALQFMAKSYGGKGGSIVNVSSLAAQTGAPFEYMDYAASKAAMDALTRGLAQEMAQEGVRVNGVRPAFIYTDMHASGGEPNRIARMIPQIPMRRGGTPEEVAEAIFWLLSDASSYTTGNFLTLSGGV
jgi:NAD(P)-dependent dehydrogenase (short-subunit alcohol dehydrogenase family)